MVRIFCINVMSMVGLGLTFLIRSTVLLLKAPDFFFGGGGGRTPITSAPVERNRPN